MELLAAGYFIVSVSLSMLDTRVRACLLYRTLTSTRRMAFFTYTAVYNT